jgi:glutamate-ammonia-ligase adenylyltransferase
MEFDPRLRPDGRFGRLSRTPAEYAAYYASEAATWEKQTLLKARFVAGSQAVGDAYLEVARSVVFGRPPTEAQVEEMRAMKRRIEAERVRPADLRTDLKLGWGAMADIEWTAQLLQWRHGHAHAALRAATGTRTTLETLARLGLLRRDDFLTLGEGYDFLARLRNTGYLRTGLPENRLPTGNEERLRALARLVGFTDDEGSAASEQLLAAHKARTEAVRAVFRRLFRGEAQP